mmetsp:Transcript_241/g.446  ORF Transcript_241/g.446 Transcript_241/m.446 type:complete len:454 (-) Transcript_241:367-1728(-)
MGRGKPRRDQLDKPDAPVGGPELADSDVEEADIEALARSRLGAGEFILGEEPKPDLPPEAEDTAKRGVCLAPLLLQRLGELEYKVPEGAKRVPWVDTLAIDGQGTLPKGVTAKDGVKLESAFLGMAAEAAAEGYRRLRVMKIPCTRPDDFYAEMMRPDKQMYRVRQQAAEEERRIKIVEDRKKHQASKKFAKKARSKKLEARAQEKRNSLEQIANWRARKKTEGNNTDDQDLEEILSRQGKRKDQDGKGKGKGKAMKSAKRKNLDEKYGFGGKKKRLKQNDKSSTNDLSAAPWGKVKSKGKGKGKGKGKSKSYDDYEEDYGYSGKGKSKGKSSEKGKGKKGDDKGKGGKKGDDKGKGKGKDKGKASKSRDYYEDDYGYGGRKGKGKSYDSYDSYDDYGYGGKSKGKSKGTGKSTQSYGSGGRSYNDWGYDNKYEDRGYSSKGKGSKGKSRDWW